MRIAGREPHADAHDENEDFVCAEKTRGERHERRQDRKWSEDCSSSSNREPRQRHRRRSGACEPGQADKHHNDRDYQ